MIGSGHEILLIGNDDVDRTMVRRALAQRTQVEEANCVTDGLAYLARASPDCVVLDLGRPDSQDLATLNRVRSAAHHVPVVVLSGVDDQGFARQALQAGAAECLVKASGKQASLAQSIWSAVERFQFRRQRENRERRFEAAIETMGATVFEHDIPVGSSLVLDGHGPALFGLRHADLPRGGELVVWLANHIHPEDRARVHLLHSTFVDGRIEHFDVIARVRVGSERWINVRCRARATTRNDDGTVRSVLGTIVPLGESTTVRSSHTRAERARSVATFATGLTHEINASLTMLQSDLERLEHLTHADLAAGESGTWNGLEATVRDAVRNAATLASTVSRLRSMSWAARRSRAVTAVRSAVQSALLVTEHDLRKSATLETSLSGDYCVSLHEWQLSQVIVNLLRNAHESLTDRHRTHNKLRVAMYARQRSTAVVEVRDTGIGISPDVLPRIYDPFFSTKADRAHPGLGLAVAENIVSAVGGQIRCQSHPGQGTTFFVELPTTVRPPTSPAFRR